MLKRQIFSRIFLGLSNGSTFFIVIVCSSSHDEAFEGVAGVFSRFHSLLHLL